MLNITPQQLRKAADIQERIQSLQSGLNQILGGEVPTPAQATEAPKTYKFSAAARAKMRAAQKARWAKMRAAKRTQAEPADKAAQEKPKKKRKMTAAWRKALERAWAARRAKGKAAGKA